MQSKKFVKMQGTGNDFMIVQPDFFSMSNKRPPHGTFSQAQKSKITPIVIQLCMPKFGIGADGVLIISDTGHRYKMTVFNSNGTFALMCGNGLRCVAAYLYSNKKVGERFVVATDSGDKEVEVRENRGRDSQVSINLGSPSNIEQLHLQTETHPLFGEYLKDTPIFYGGLGNCHFVLFLPDEAFRKIQEANSFAPISAQLIKIRQGNVNFCRVDSRRSMRNVTCEMGAGVTLACGTGSAIAAYVGLWSGRMDERVEVCNRGGVLGIVCERREGRDVLFMTGPARWVFSGEVDVEI